jgi:hypothetical protein
MFPMSDGLAGGYPGAPNAYVWHHNNGGADGGEQPVDWGVFPLMGADTLEVRWNGGGGVGDPLRRPAKAVAADVASGLVSAAAAQGVYGVVLNDAGDVDEAATGSLRGQRLAARAENAAGVDARERASAAVNLRLVGANGAAEVVCAQCDHHLAAAGEAWKSHAAATETPLGDKMATYTVDDEVHLREFACPNCGVLLDSEIAYQGDPPLLDYLGSVPHA